MAADAPLQLEMREKPFGPCALLGGHP
jgi:hypothetical protein